MAVDKYEPTYDFSDDLGNTHGLRLDIEFANVSQTTGELSDALNLIQRSDGKIRDSAVDVHTLSRDVMNLIGGYRTRGGWTSATAYAVNDVIDNAGCVYVCKTAHTSSGSFLSDAANWVKFGFGPSTLAQATADSALNDITAHLAAATGAHDASEIAYAGGTSLAASSVEAAIDALDSGKAPLASPSFTGTPTAPTAAPGSAGSQVANAAFVAAAVAAAIPSVGSIASSAIADIQKALPPPVRQTVLSGPVDSSGNSSFGGSTGATSVTASGVIKATCAAGGDLNRTGSITNPSWTGLTTNGSMFLYLDIAEDGTVTTGSTTLAPIYQWGGSYSSVSGQNTFNIQEMTMKVGNGSSSATVYRVFVGEVTVSGGVVASIVWYSLMARYDSGWTATLPGVGVAVSRNCNIGCADQIVRFVMECTTADAGYSIGDRISVVETNSGSNMIVLPVWSSRNACGFTVGSSNTFYFGNKTNGGAGIFTSASWKYKIVSVREW